MQAGGSKGEWGESLINIGSLSLIAWFYQYLIYWASMLTATKLEISGIDQTREK